MEDSVRAYANLYDEIVQGYQDGTRERYVEDDAPETAGQKMKRLAQADREKAYNKYIMQHEMAVAKQQSEALSKAYGGMSEAFEIAAKISKGGKVSSH